MTREAILRFGNAAVGSSPLKSIRCAEAIARSLITAGLGAGKFCSASGVNDRPLQAGIATYTQHISTTQPNANSPTPSNHNHILTDATIRDSTMKSSQEWDIQDHSDRASYHGRTRKD